MDYVIIQLLIYIVVFIAQGCVFGYATRSIIHNKGYRDDWFWWGFFFGLIALIVALAKPDNPVRVSASSRSQTASETKEKKDNKEKNDNIIRFKVTKTNRCDDFIPVEVTSDNGSLSVVVTNINKGVLSALEVDMEIQNVFDDIEKINHLHFTGFNKEGGRRLVSKPLLYRFQNSNPDAIKSVGVVTRRYIYNDRTVTPDDRTLHDMSTVFEEQLQTESQLLLVLEEAGNILKMKSAAEAYYRENGIEPDEEVMQLINRHYEVARLYGGSERQTERALKDIRKLYQIDDADQQNSNVHFCFKCGSPLHAGAAFCSKCGEKV